MLQEALRHEKLEPVLLTVMYLIRYFQGVKCVDCEINPLLTGNQCLRIAVEREEALIPKNKADFNSVNVYDCNCLISVYLNIMVTTKRCAYGTCKNDSRYPNSWVRNANGDPVKFFHFPGAVRQKERRQRWIRSCHRGDSFVCTKDTATFVVYILSVEMVQQRRILIPYLLQLVKKG